MTKRPFEESGYLQIIENQEGVSIRLSPSVNQKRSLFVMDGHRRPWPQETIEGSHLIGYELLDTSGALLESGERRISPKILPDQDYYSTPSGSPVDGDPGALTFEDPEPVPESDPGFEEIPESSLPFENPPQTSDSPGPVLQLPSETLPSTVSAAEQASIEKPEAILDNKKAQEQTANPVKPDQSVLSASLPDSTIAESVRVRLLRSGQEMKSGKVYVSDLHVLKLEPSMAESELVSIRDLSSGASFQTLEEAAQDERASRWKIDLLESSGSGGWEIIKVPASVEASANGPSTRAQISFALCENGQVASYVQSGQSEWQIAQDGILKNSLEVFPGRPFQIYGPMDPEQLSVWIDGKETRTKIHTDPLGNRVLSIDGTWKDELIRIQKEETIVYSARIRCPLLKQGTVVLSGLTAGLTMMIVLLLYMKRRRMRNG